VWKYGRRLFYLITTAPRSKERRAPGEREIREQCRSKSGFVFHRLEQLGTAQDQFIVKLGRLNNYPTARAKPKAGYGAKNRSISTLLGNSPNESLQQGI
jgi:hypothetical protein